MRLDTHWQRLPPRLDRDRPHPHHHQSSSSRDSHLLQVLFSKELQAGRERHCHCQPTLQPGETSAKNIPSACPLLESCTDPARQRTGTTHSMLKEDAACGVPETAWTAGPALQQARRGRAPWGESDQLFLSSLRGNTFSSSTLLDFKKRSCNRLANQIKLLERAGRRNSHTRPPWVPQCGRAARARVAAPPSSSILRRPPAPCRNAVRGFFRSGRRDHGTVTHRAYPSDCNE